MSSTARRAIARQRARDLSASLINYIPLLTGLLFADTFIFLLIHGLTERDSFGRNYYRTVAVCNGKYIASQSDKYLF